MARVTHVKAAQQRFATVPVIDPDTSVQKVVPVFRKNGEPKKTKKSREITRRITVEDKSQPLPNRTCDKCHKEITVGSPYKWIAPKSGPYGGSKRFRCGECPSWAIWEYSSSLSARLAEVQHNFETSFSVDDAESADDVTSALSEFAEAVRELAQEKEEGADNIESGFGHETSQSSELRETADLLNGWADEIDQAEVPDYPEPEEQDCETCGGKGEIDAGGDGVDSAETTPCEDCEGACVVTPDEPTEDQINEWRSAVEDAVSSVADNCPV